MKVVETHPHTPDKRYFIVKGRLWRLSKPDLKPEVRQQLVQSLMEARRAIRKYRDLPDELAAIRMTIDTIKIALGERGPVWWDDGAPDYNRRLVKNTPYRDWFDEMTKK